MSAGRKKSVEKSVLASPIVIVNSANPVIRIVQTLSKKSVLQDSVFHMSVMDVKALVNVHF